MFDLVISFRSLLIAFIIYCVIVFLYTFFKRFWKDFIKKKEVKKTMSRREYIWTFFDIDGYYQILLDNKNLSESEREVKRNKHNIDILNNRSKINAKKNIENKSITGK